MNPGRKSNLDTFRARTSEGRVIWEDNVAALLANQPPIRKDLHRKESVSADAVGTTNFLPQISILIGRGGANLRPPEFPSNEFRKHLFQLSREPALERRFLFLRKCHEADPDLARFPPADRQFWFEWSIQTGQSELHLHFFFGMEGSQGVQGHTPFANIYAVTTNFRLAAP